MTDTTVRQLASALDLSLASILGDPDRRVGPPGTLSEAAREGFAFCRWDGSDGAEQVRTTLASVVVCPLSADESWRRSDQTLVRVRTPRTTFAKALSIVAPIDLPAPGVHPSAVVAETSVIDPTATIGPHVVIGDGCSIAAHVVLHPHVVIGRGVSVGERTAIFAGTVIGADGFGYEHDEDGTVVKIPHIGGVRIGRDVEIGANTCIDRGTLGDTVIGDSARVDNLVHIAHNVRVGRRAFVIALSMVGGSTIIEDDAWVAPGAVLRNGIIVGARSTVGLGAVVTRSVDAGTTVMGNPARPRESPQ